MRDSVAAGCTLIVTNRIHEFKIVKKRKAVCDCDYKQLSFSLEVFNKTLVHTVPFIVLSNHQLNFLISHIHIVFSLIIWWLELDYAIWFSFHHTNMWDSNCSLKYIRIHISVHDGVYQYPTKLRKCLWQKILVLIRLDRLIKDLIGYLNYFVFISKQIS